MERLKGISMIIVGAIFWGATGPMMEWLMAEHGMNPEFMLAVRLIIAGSIILVVQQARKVPVLAIWKERPWRNQLLLFSVVGMVGLQYTFVKAIETSDAIVATLLQFLAPIFIIIYVAISYKKWPLKSQVIGIVGTLVGLVLLMTNGSLGTLSNSGEALIWGVFLGLTYAFYTLYPARLMKEWGVLTIVGWAMIISSVIFSCMARIWESPDWQLFLHKEIVVMFIGLVILGTLAYILFMGSLTYISAVEVSILSSMEPLAAMILSVIWLGTVLQMWQLVGIGLMLLFVAYLSIAGGRK